MLSCSNKNREIILSTEDVEYLICANFKVFDNKVEPRLLFPKIGSGAIKRFIYDFYFDHDDLKYNNKQKKYCKLLIENFEDFKDKEITYLTKKLSLKQPKYYPFNSK